MKKIKNLEPVYYILIGSLIANIATFFDKYDAIYFPFLTISLIFIFFGIYKFFKS
jgi:hypothetical protein